MPRAQTASLRKDLKLSITRGMAPSEESQAHSASRTCATQNWGKFVF